jgi:hypothetical protein
VFGIGPKEIKNSVSLNTNNKNINNNNNQINNSEQEDNKNINNAYTILEFLKFESSTKSFKSLPVKIISSTVDAIILNNLMRKNNSN